MNFLVITWDVSKVLIDLGIIEIRYYSLLFALGFVIGYFIMKRIFIEEKIPIEQLDTLLTYVVIATIIGARLGHVFFYQWDYYSQHPEEILMVWEGGLASHGAAISIIIALVIYSKKVSKRSFFWIIDRVVITVALAGCFIRLGNLMNSEIYGSPTNSRAAFVYVSPVRDIFERFFGKEVQELSFKKSEEVVVTDTLIMPVYEVELKIDARADASQVISLVTNRLFPYLKMIDSDDQNLVPGEISSPEIVKNSEGTYITFKLLAIPRIPSQIIEATAYLIVFLVLWIIFFHTRFRHQEGFLFGAFLILVFGFRFVIEFFKANQVAFEDSLTFNMGQYLSIPLILVGIASVIYSFVKKK
ncbi:MAG: prolipoprotein diacylglyceryl transferase [Thermaurantimonas sp.]